MAHHTQPHAYISTGQALTGTSIYELIRPGLRLAFPLPADENANEETFRRLLDTLAERAAPGRQSDERVSISE